MGDRQLTKAATLELPAELTDSSAVRRAPPSPSVLIAYIAQE